MIFGLTISNSRLDDEQSVAVIEFSDTPTWLQSLNRDPCGFPKKTVLGTLWRGLDTSAVDGNGRTEFSRAAAVKGTPNLYYAEMLAEFGDTDTNIQDKQGWTALHWACAENIADMVRLCLSVPECDVGIRDKDGFTAFDISLRGGDEVIPTLFYSSMLEMEKTDPQATLLRLLTITSEPAKDKPVFPGAAIFDPILDCNTALVRALINRGIDLTAINLDGDTALHVAVKAGDVDTISMLLNAGSDVNAIGNQGATPLHYATDATDKKILELLLNWKASLNVNDSAGETALNVTVYEKWDALLMGVAGLEEETKIERRAAAESPEGVVRVPPDGIGLLKGEEMSTFYTAAMDGDHDIMRALLEQGTNTDATEWQLDIALHLATAFGHMDIVQTLLDAGANPEATDDWGNTPLHTAALKGHTEVVKVLLDNKAQIEAARNERSLSYRMGYQGLFKTLRSNTTEKWGERALHVAVKAGQLEVVRELLARGAQVDAVGDSGSTPLHLATQGGHLEIVKILLASSAQIDLVDGLEHSPLYQAVGFGKSEIIKVLLAGGAKTEVVSNSGQTALHRAAELGNAVAGKELLDWGADQEMISKSRWTPLHYAASGGHLDFVQLLLSRGAQKYPKDLTRRTPLALAKKAGHLDLISLLK